MRLFAAILPILFRTLHTSIAITCQSEKGTSVDWFLIYKFSLGYDYIYMDANHPVWEKSEHTVDSTNGGAIYNTVQSSLNALISSNIVSFFYNDEKPIEDNDSNIYGHMKGIVSFEKAKKGIWLIHSVPKFPNKGTYQFPPSGKIFAQSFFCVTYDYSVLGLIVKQLLYGRPQIYEYNLPRSVSDDYPDLLHLVSNMKIKVNNTYSIETFASDDKRIVVVDFMKTSTFGRDLYDSLVAPTLNRSLHVEGWVNGQGALPSNCTAKYKVENIRAIQFTPLLIHFTTSHDHSKWAIEVKNGTYWVCIADINREVGQFHRGGGAACFQDITIWKQYYALIAETDSCPRIF